jgi:Protein of unknown function (DUF3054)
MRVGAAIAADGAAILTFATIGRLSHAEGLGLPGVIEVAWPFLAGGAVGTLIGRTWRRPSALSSGVWVWLGTVAGGMLLRWLTGGGVQLSFVIVASVVLAVFLLGWRLVTRALALRRGVSGAADVRSSSIGGAPR